MLAYILLGGLYFFGVTVAQEPIPKDRDLELQFVQVIWRHGDRSPTRTCPTDPTQEEQWTFGGGGWGQLSPLGMQMHVQLGRKLRRRYVETGFLNERYRANEVYFRSTDVNRTLLSAVCNTIGMYGQGSATLGEDVPKLKGNEDYNWPAGFVPIPIHTINDDYDYWGNPDMICPRQLKVWDLAQQSKEIQALLALNTTKLVFDTLKQQCNKTYDLGSLWEVVDAFFIERAYNISNPGWMTDDLYNLAFKLNQQAQDFVNGINLSPVNGFDVSKEMQRIRSGSMLGLLTDQIKQKRDCLESLPLCSKWMSKLKYFVYSAHDTTVYAYLTALNSEKLVITDGGYPHYSAAVITEHWRDSKKNDFVKFVYHNGFGDNFTVFTPMVEACRDFEIYCPFEKFEAVAANLSSSQWGGAEAMCADTDLFGKSEKKFAFYNNGLISSILVLIWAFLQRN
ncbi:unnamed protein product, partial [Mesorhabditis belari]|uniref:Acid phosphatase n=1 Tax=Mesorhabditis belari TaxID=2138241 RepID=A0AAF3EEP1_9BILA